MSKFNVTCEFYKTENTISKRLTIKNSSCGNIFLRIEEGEKCTAIEVNGKELILAISHCLEDGGVQ